MGRSKVSLIPSPYIREERTWYTLLTASSRYTIISTVISSISTPHFSGVPSTVCTRPSPLVYREARSKIILTYMKGFQCKFPRLSLCVRFHLCQCGRAASILCAVLWLTLAARGWKTLAAIPCRLVREQDVL